MLKVVKNNRVLICQILIINIISMLIIIGVPYNKDISRLKEIGYRTLSSIRIYKSDNYEYIKENNYSEIIDKCIKNDNFNDNYIDIYYEINYKNIDNFMVVINSLIESGYLISDINKIIDNYDEYLVIYLTSNKVVDISNYLDYKYFNSKNIDRYLKYFNGDYKDTIINVNIGLDKEYYEDSVIVNEYNKNMIVNKYNKLSKTFVPPKLEKIKKCTKEKYYLTKEAKDAFNKLCEASIKDNMGISISSAYRSYDEQEEIYNYYVEESGVKYADNFVARPGFSEHQTGLSVDIVSLSSTYFVYSKEYKWMKENAYKYGFILRYEDDKKDITGYNGEAWHYRYVGEEVAKYIYENDITYEEYYAMNYN